MSETMVVTSTRTSAGKTTVGLGCALASIGVKIGYLKPFGDRMVYKKKHLLDSDAILFRSVLGAPGAPEGHCLGFDYELLWKQSKTTDMSKELRRHLKAVSAGRDIVLVESAFNFSYGRWAGLDAISIARALDAEILLVADGDPGIVYDKCAVFNECASDAGIKLNGVIINRISPAWSEKMGWAADALKDDFSMNIYGMVPELPEIGRLTMDTVVEKLSAKVLAGGGGLGRAVERVRVGAMSAESAIAVRAFHEPHKLIITSGDRVDFILLALESNTSGIILTNGVVPHSNILAKAEEVGVPILSVQTDTYTTAKLVERIVPEVRPTEEAKIAQIEKGIRKNVDVAKALGL
ncbi:MAG: DRTGG domain-containing protein [Methanobacteriota archaeon]